MERENIEKQAPNPKTTSNFLSFIFYGYVFPIIKLGIKKELNIEDLYKVLPEDESEKLGLKLQSEWMKERNKFTGKNEDGSYKKGKPSFTRALIRTFGLKIVLIGFLLLLEECGLRIAQVLFLSNLLGYFDDKIEAETAYLFATGLVVCVAGYIMSHHQFFLICYHTGMQMRVASCSVVYKKCMMLSQKALGQTTIGQMVNIMSNDVNRFDLSVNFIHYFWVGPLQCIVATIILYTYIGPSCLVGLGVLVLYVPLQSWLGGVFSKFRTETAELTDERIKTMNEIITGMRVIKMYTWEKPFEKLISLSRRLEVNVNKRTAYFRALNQSLFFTSSKLFIFLILIVYVLTGNALTPDKVFLTVALFNYIRLTMTLFFPNAISCTAEALVSIKRIEDFLLLDEKSTEEIISRPKLEDCKIDCQNVTVKWPAAAETEDNTLTDVSFSVSPGQVLAVVGQVGSGKSSLLNVILGELSCTKGNCRVKGKIAYASQEPWIFSATIRRNILCGSEYDGKRYRKVVKAAALERDFALFPQGDQTTVGERGISLSGGQKARINLARCLYVDADIYLMDDPLSAVDTHVGRHLFDKAVNGFLHDKIRVLVTHQLQYLKDVNQILVLKGGNVEAIGTYEELNSLGVNLSRTIDEEINMIDEEIEEAFAILEDETRSSVRSRALSKLSVRRRRSSAVSLAKPKNEASSGFAEESRKEGSVSFSAYGRYFRAGGGYVSILLLILSCLFTQVLFSASDFWLNIWTNAEEIRALNETISINSTSWQNQVDTITGVYVYTILIVGVFIFSMIRTVHFFLLSLYSSIKLHDNMFKAVIRTPLLFFDQNPVGRILNRFAKDIGTMDDQLPATFFDFIGIGLNALGIVVITAVVDLWLVLPILFLSFVFYLLRRIYLTVARAVKRLESTTRSPVFTHLSSSLVGLTTLRAHKCEEIFQRAFDDCQNIHSSAWYAFLSTSRWFGFYLDWVAVIYVTCVTYISVVLKGTITGSAAGLVISSAMTLTGLFQWAIRQSAETENNMTSVERVMEYGQLPSEAALESTKDKKPPPSWPSKGSLIFENMSLRYNEKNDPVLKNINCQINSNDKVGIVGRTGAGKSSLIVALFRLSEPEGKIIIDGIDIKNIGLHELRAKISIIPQDPFLFSGSLRRNLDPFGEYNDELLWKALDDVKLKESLSDLEAGLDSVITEGGSNLSVGQRQLVCLARAILRQNKILVLDEATANVDQKTDSLIQLTIREKFIDCTVLTIAHRLNTIMDSDRVMVLDAGCLKEFDEPLSLLENTGSMFHSLVEQTGPIAATQLKSLAEEASIKRAKSC